MCRGVKIPWIIGQNARSTGCDMPWVGGQNTMDSGANYHE